MKNSSVTVAVFLATFVLGSSANYFALLGIAKLSEFVPPAMDAIETAPLPIAKIDYSKPPLFNPNINYPKHLSVKLLQTGEFHSEEVPYNSGEKWLGLFRSGDRYQLRTTSIRVKKLDADGLMDTEVQTSDSNTSVFLLRNATNLVAGEVETVFDVERGDEFDLSAKSSFGRRGQFWKLWTENAAAEGYPQKGSALILEQSGGDLLTLRSIPDGCNDCGWQVIWVGDLDRDGHLDFLIDVSRHYNVYEPTLFLSSRGYSVFAGFWGVGC